MEFFVNFFQPRVRYVGVHLGRRNRRMPQKLLYRADIGTVRKKGRGKRMPERMGRNVFHDSRGHRPARHHGSNEVPAETHVVVRKRATFSVFSFGKEIFGIEIIPDEQWFKRIVSYR